VPRLSTRECANYFRHLVACRLCVRMNGMRFSPWISVLLKQFDIWSQNVARKRSERAGTEQMDPMKGPGGTVAQHIWST
jgi:hypothetical protein